MNFKVLFTWHLSVQTLNFSILRQRGPHTCRSEGKSNKSNIEYLKPICLPNDAKYAFEWPKFDLFLKGIVGIAVGTLLAIPGIMTNNMPAYSFDSSQCKVYTQEAARLSTSIFTKNFLATLTDLLSCQIGARERLMTRLSPHAEESLFRFPSSERRSSPERDVKSRGKIIWLLEIKRFANRL